MFTTNDVGNLRGFWSTKCYTSVVPSIFKHFAFWGEGRMACSCVPWAGRVPPTHRAHCIIEVFWERHAADNSPKTSKRSNVVTCGAHAHHG